MYNWRQKSHFIDTSTTKQKREKEWAETTNRRRKEKSKYQLLYVIPREKNKVVGRKVDRKRKKLARESLKYLQSKITNFNQLKIKRKEKK